MQLLPTPRPSPRPRGLRVEQLELVGVLGVVWPGATGGVTARDSLHSARGQTVRLRDPGHQGLPGGDVSHRLCLGPLESLGMLRNYTIIHSHFGENYNFLYNNLR